MAQQMDTLLENIKDRMDIVELIGEYLELKKSGSSYMGLCPFHNEKTPSFSVNDSKQLFHCFGCGESGDGITFIMKKENLDFKEALQYLADKYNILYEYSNDRQSEGMKKKYYEINRLAAKHYYDNLKNEKKAQVYLQKRGLSLRSITKFGLGYAKNDWESTIEYLHKKNISYEDLETLGLSGINKNGGHYSKFRDKIIFPIIDTKGRVIGFGSRVLDNTLPKYINSKESIVFNKGNNLFGLNIIAKESDRKRIILVEGYLDVISLYEAGINYAAASLGTALTENQAKLLKRYGEEIYICYDSDKAGNNATLKALDIFDRLELKPKVVMLPEGQDPDDYIKKNKLQNFEIKLNESLTPIEFRLYILKQSFDLQKLEQKVEYAKQATKAIKLLKSPIEIEAQIEKLSKELGFSKVSIDSEVQKQNKPQDIKKSNKSKKTKIQAKSSKVEEDIICLAVYNKDYFKAIEKGISIEDFSNKACKILFENIKALYNTKDEINKQDVLEALDSEVDIIDESEKILSSRMNFQASNIDKAIEELIGTLKLRKLERLRLSVLKEIDMLSTKGADQEKLAALLNTLHRLSKEIAIIQD